MVSFILELFAWFFAGLTCLAVVGFFAYSAWLGRGIAKSKWKYAIKQWIGRQKSSAKDRLKKVAKCVLLLFCLGVSGVVARPNTAQEVIGVHNGKFTPVPESQVVPVIVKPYTGYSGPTATPTPTFTWNATTTRTQPPTPTATATNTPELVRSDVRYIRQSDNPTPSSNLLIPAASPTPIVFAATTPGYHHKIEVCAQNIGSAPGVLTAGGMTYNFAPYTPRTLYLFSAANGPITLDTTYVAGVSIRCNILHAIVKDGF